MHLCRAYFTITLVITTHQEENRKISLEEPAPEELYYEEYFFYLIIFDESIQLLSSNLQDDSYLSIRVVRSVLFSRIIPHISQLRKRNNLQSLKNECLLTRTEFFILFKFNECMSIMSFDQTLF